MFYSTNKLSKIFQTAESEILQKPEIENVVKAHHLIEFHKDSEGEARGVGYAASEIPQLGEFIGYIKKPDDPKVISIFVTKGGVLKTTLTLNMARMAALHNMKTLVIGLDMQCDITSAMGIDFGANEDNLTSAMSEIDKMKGLSDFFYDRCEINDVILKTDLPTLDIIPETPELVAIEQSLLHRAKRELWLKEKVIVPLKSQYDLFIIDCSPNWNQLITNALAASDLLISPLECKINNYRNFQMFRSFINEFKDEMDLSFEHLYIPTRLTQSRKLSKEIRDWYVNEISNCVPFAIRDSIIGEEATAMNLSIPEYQPGSEAAKEINEVIQYIWQRFHPHGNDHLSAQIELSQNDRKDGIL
ncbi:MAG: AAA family ATPase [Bdellovibrionales bacterium]|nr:AAA family ATPase [Bdellovibrionales bacterium]